VEASEGCERFVVEVDSSRLRQCRLGAHRVFACSVGNIKVRSGRLLRKSKALVQGVAGRCRNGMPEGGVAIRGGCKAEVR
jgi:hypothetical protein